MPPESWRTDERGPASFAGGFGRRIRLAQAVSAGRATLGSGQAAAPWALARKGEAVPAKSK
jgi:hypothetical protein